MKKDYTEPELTYIALADDVVRTSGGTGETVEQLAGDTHLAASKVFGN